MKKLFLAALIFLFAASAYAQSESETGRYLVPVKKSDLVYGRQNVCVLEQCYYIVDKVGAERSLSSGEAKVYYPEVLRRLDAPPNDPNDYYFVRSEQRHLIDNTIGWESGWKKIKILLTLGSVPVPVVAVIDTGIVDHEDLPFTSLYGEKAYEANGVNPTTSGVDRGGHGTHVAGIIGALTNNGIGVASVGGGKVKVMSIRAATPCGGSDPDAVCIGSVAVIDAIGKILDEKTLRNAPIVAVNMSFGGSSKDPLEITNIRKLEENGIIVVAAAGNDEKDLDSVSYSRYPAKYALPNIITVAAVNSYYNRPSFSNYGKTVNIAAPGEHILSLDIDQNPNPYIYKDGTSMAAPFIAGLLGAGVALYNKDRAAGKTYPDITAAQLMNILYDSSSTRSGLNIEKNRLVNVDAFLQKIEECRNNAVLTGALCTQAKNTYQDKDEEEPEEEEPGPITPPTPPTLPPNPNPNPTPTPTPDPGWRGSDSGGCSLAVGDKGGLPSFLLLLISIPLFIAVRRRV